MLPPLASAIAAASLHYSFKEGAIVKKTTFSPRPWNRPFAYRFDIAMNGVGT
ncbi:hypothetical protein HBH64_228500 [Parastagonospora nodorum]|nr:hypothetical protein HBH47_214760 [Parastagonospora nodorum]KAH4310204.1 hypothetical protein HBI01_022320 [Parastagonospora nodorum]KAH4315567.1 hypothetical protein HBI02_057830 [Parastagonospora nodorum]KAH4320259.1 hypothetical protein HBI00_229130 [Parastagonospora nodorum]KAH4386837.1 hypothetical protein HBH94_046340 [Parastagonospora nodorum]